MTYRILTVGPLRAGLYFARRVVLLVCVRDREFAWYLS